MAQRSLVNVNMEDEQLQELLANFEKNVGPLSTQMARGIAVRLRNRLRKVMEEKGHKNTGYMSSNMKVERVGEKDYIVTAPFYLRYLETGTRPHHIPRQSKTVLWARRHGMTFNQFRSVVAKRGTKAHPFTERTMINLQNEYRNEIERRINIFMATRATQTETL